MGGVRQGCSVPLSITPESGCHQQSLDVLSLCPPGEVVMEGDQCIEGKGAHPLLWRETRAWRGREPTPCSGGRPGHGGEGSPPLALEGNQGMEGKGAHLLLWSTGSSDAVYHLSCHHIPRLEQGNRRVITPPMADPVMESELHNIFLCAYYILLSHSSS